MRGVASIFRSSVRNRTLKWLTRLPSVSTGAIRIFTRSRVLKSWTTSRMCVEVTPGLSAETSSCGFFGDAVIVRFARDHQAPLAYQFGTRVEIEPYPTWNLTASYLRVRGLRLGSLDRKSTRLNSSH